MISDASKISTRYQKIAKIPNLLNYIKNTKMTKKCWEYQIKKNTKMVKKLLQNFYSNLEITGTAAWVPYQKFPKLPNWPKNAKNTKFKKRKNDQKLLQNFMEDWE